MPDDYNLTDTTVDTQLQQSELRVLEDTKNQADEQEAVNQVYGLVANIRSKFDNAKRVRMPNEQRWLNAWNNFRGVYDNRTTFRDSEQSKAFVKITKTKVMAAFNAINEIIFQGTKFPLTVEPTEKPAGIAEYAHLEPDGAAENAFNADPIGFEGDGNTLPPGATYSTLLNGLTDKYEGADLKEGPAPDSMSMPQIKPAEEAAINMQKTIHDQIDESNGHIWIKKAIFEGCLFGTGVVKGPYTIEKTLHKWEKDEVSGAMSYNPITSKSPEIAWVSIWNYYPDPDARNDADKEWDIERHKMSRKQLRDLAKMPYFRKEAISRALMSPPNYTKEFFELALEDANSDPETSRYEVLEYWGTMGVEEIKDTAIDIDGVDIDGLEEIQVNVWLCGDEILRLVVNPFTPATSRYHGFPYEQHDYQYWGVGVAENMQDCQDVMNAFARLGIDNAVLSSNVMLDVDEMSLVPGQDMKFYPGKAFRRQSGQPGQAIYSIEIPSTFEKCFSVFDRFRQLSDEATGMPSYSHGQTGVTSTTRTSSGLSMLMGAADRNIKGVVINIDDFIIQPLGEGMFHWNMQFNEDDRIKGDLVVKARGTAGLMAKEIRSQRLLQFLQVGMGNPATAPFINAEHILKQLALALDLEPEEVCNDPTTAAIYAKIMGMAGGMQGGDQAAMGQTGSDNIGMGANPQPGAPGFTGNSTEQASANAMQNPATQQP